MGIFSRIKRKPRQERIDANRIYTRVMERSRQPQFFGPGRFPDTLQARLSVLTLHLAPVMKTLGEQGDTGQFLSQALYDTMVKDFDMALREEGLSDSGIKRRIKPIIRLFYTRLKEITEALAGHKGASQIAQMLKKTELTEAGDNFVTDIGAYVVAFHNLLDGLSVGDLAQAEFGFPDIPQ